MSVTLSQYFDYGTPVTSNPPISANSFASQTSRLLQNTTGCQVIASGALTADTYPGTPILTFSGSGYISFAAIRQADATSRTITLKVTIDGVDFEVSGTPTGTTDHGYSIVGAFDEFYTGTQGLTFEKIPFNSSLAVNVKSSLTETDKVEAIVKYWRVS